MKRILEFQMCENGYGFYEKQDLVFEVSKADLQFDVKKFYLAFFADDNNYSDIELQNMLSADKEATRVFNCTEQLIKEIVRRLTEEQSERLEKDVDIASPA